MMDGIVVAGAESEIPPVLAYLDELVGADRGPPGFRGVVCMGVQMAWSTSWWVASFDRTVRARFSSRMPLGFDVAVGLTEEQAEAFARGGAISGKGLVTGDRRILQAFASRYLRTRNWLSARVAAQAPRRGGRS